MLSAELYSNSHMLNPRMASHTIFSYFNPLNAELNPFCHLLALLGGATIVVVSRLKVNDNALLQVV